MIFQQMLLEILKKLKSERTIVAPFHILRGKRSGSTIQDVGIFQLHSYYSILPKLSREVYNYAMKQLIHNHWIEIDENQYYRLSNEGLDQLKNPLQLTFDGWNYRGNEQLFFARLSLIVQSLSHHKESVKSFRPIQKDENVQQWVKQYLLSNNYKEGYLQGKLYEDIVISLDKINVDSHVKNILIHRLSGYKMPGWTWQQMSHHLKITEIDAQLLYISCLHHWLHEIEQSNNYPLLSQMTEGVRIVNTLTHSASQTARLFKQGYSVDQIVQIRNLKQSTIEDHLVELAMNDPTFPITQFISEEEIKSVWDVVKKYNSRKLKVIYEALQGLSYFQIRLVLAKGEKTIGT